MSAATDEIKLRIPPEQKTTIQQAAEAAGVNLSQFIREAAQTRADEVLAQVQLRQVTVIPPASFDELLNALDEPGRPSRKLVEAARALRSLELD